MRVMVSGHLGYIGTVMAPVLADAGHEVIGLDSDLYRRATFGDPRNLPAVHAILKDIRDVELEDLEGVDAVVHLAALSNDPLGDLDPELTYDVNHRATVRLAELARAAGASRFLFSSSCSNYGASGARRSCRMTYFGDARPTGSTISSWVVRIDSCALGNRVEPGRFWTCSRCPRSWRWARPIAGGRSAGCSRRSCGCRLSWPLR